LGRVTLDDATILSLFGADDAENETGERKAGGRGERRTYPGGLGWNK
jgi:hypothetical protein